VNPAAFGAWLLTALAGFVLFATWTTGGGTKKGAFPPAMVFGHLGLAAVGLFAWIVHLVSGSDGAAWLAAVVLIPLVLLGLAMLSIWLRGRDAPGNADPRSRPPEQWLPPSVVVLHGMGALATVVLVVIATIR
jgi:hypothetical protein